MAKKSNPKGAGRKAKGPFSGGLVPISARIPHDLKAQLSEAAEKSGLSVNQEVGVRLTHSFTHFHFEELNEFGSSEIFSVCRLIGMMMRGYHAFDGDEMWENERAHSELKDAVVTILDAFGPHGGMPEPFQDETDGQRRGRSRLSQLYRGRALPDYSEGQSANDFSHLEIWEGLGDLAKKLEPKK